MALQKMNVESFNLDHTKVKAPYIRVAGYKEGKVDQVVKYDIRFTQPNVEQMPMRAMHTLEHLLAETSATTRMMSSMSRRWDAKQVSTWR